MSPGARSTIVHDRHPGLVQPGRLQYPRCSTPCRRARGTVAQHLAGQVRAFERSLGIAPNPRVSQGPRSVPPRGPGPTPSLCRAVPGRQQRLRGWFPGTMRREGRKTESATQPAGEARRLLATQRVLSRNAPLGEPAIVVDVVVLVVVVTTIVVLVVVEVVDVVLPVLFVDGTHSSRRWISSGWPGPNWLLVNVRTSPKEPFFVL